MFLVPLVSASRCIDGVREMLTPQHFSELTSTFLNSGKGTNDMGDKIPCDVSPQNIYAIIFFKDLISGFDHGGIGLCPPQECADEAEWKPMLDYLLETFKPYFPPTMDIQLRISYPSLEAPIPYNTGFWISISLFGMIFILGILGSIFTHVLTADS